jgi:hypothetical protein
MDRHDPSDRELEDPDAWDTETEEVHTPSARRRTQYLLELTSADFRAIAKAARRDGVTITEFLTAAALDRAAKQPAAS